MARAFRAPNFTGVNSYPRVIAVVDDELPVRSALSRLLGAAGFDVVACDGGAAFLEMLTKRPIDCVLLDLHMPEVDGFTVLERMGQAPHHPPVIVLTGHDGPAVRERVLAAGVSGYITKPVQRDVILHAIEAVLSKPSGGAS